LVRRLKARDEHALRELYDALAPWVLGLAYRILHDEDEAEEVVGDVFVKVWRHVHRHDPRRGPLEATVPGWPLHREVHAALATLPDELRRVVTLAYFEGLSHSQIAHRLQQPLGTVKTRLRAAHHKLTDRLAHLKDWLE